MKVVIIPGWYPTIHHPQSGNFIEDQVRELKKKGVDVSVLFVDFDYRYYAQIFAKQTYSLEKDIPTFRRVGFGLPKKNKLILDNWAKKYVLLFDSYVLKFGTPDLIHAHTFWGGYSAMLLSRKYKIPFVVTEHFSGILNNKIPVWQVPLYKAVYQSAKLVIAVSEALATILKDKFGVSKCTVLPNFINVERFQYYDSKKSNSRFISVGDLIECKRFDIQIKAISELIKQGYLDVKLSIVGDGSLRNKLEKLTSALGLNKNITFTGPLTSKAVSQAMQAADFLLLSSDFETFGIVLIEALACGLPVISTKCQGPIDIVKEEVGILVEKNNILDMVNAMKKLLDTPSLFDRSKIRQYAVSKYSSTVIVKQLEQLYQEAIDS